VSAQKGHLLAQGGVFTFLKSSEYNSMPAVSKTLKPCPEPKSTPSEQTQCYIEGASFGPGRRFRFFEHAVRQNNYLRARVKITSHFLGPFIPASGVSKIQNIPDIL